MPDLPTLGPNRKAWTRRSGPVLDRKTALEISVEDRGIVATADPARLSEKRTWYLAANLPHA
ncbi:hypothetical protein [Streptomyces silvisoli]|uniref:Uncharacterized protein n=1 Tax=Streptomyces silvisoli TaxID=3034235 RepID=A0ABT5ZWC2_9ACTN|nr:hypothetical protein [Streptomyces silvisoli]MDF3294122.1 hypothetical protein [Streptomyces silvisoli]